jgi:hypothetical protein
VGVPQPVGPPAFDAVRHGFTLCVYGHSAGLTTPW